MQAPDKMTPSPRYQALYRATVQEAARSGSFIMARLIALARTSIQGRAGTLRDTRLRDALSDVYARDMNVRDALAEASQLLIKHERDLCTRYPQALLAAFENPQALQKTASAPAAAVHFDELELMDEAQVHASVVMAKAQQGVLLTADASLAEFNTLLCSTLGLSVVRPERNPMRPEVYLTALKEVVENTAVTQFHRDEWFSAMSIELGKELSKLYDALSTNLRVENVVPAGYAVLPTPGATEGVGGGGGRSSSSSRANSVAYDVPATPELSRAAPASTQAARAQVGDDALLTLDKLRRLLSGELDQPLGSNHVVDFAHEFSRQFESAPVYTRRI
jgi:hypothetical protein